MRIRRCISLLETIWVTPEEWAKEPVNAIQEFLMELEPNQEYKIYDVDGTIQEGTESMHPIGLLATVAQASLISDNKYTKQWLELFWNTPVRTGKRRYYDNCLYLFAFMALSGNYRIYK